MRPLHILNTVEPRLRTPLTEGISGAEGGDFRHPKLDLKDVLVTPTFKTLHVLPRCVTDGTAPEGFWCVKNYDGAEAHSISCYV